MKIPCEYRSIPRLTVACTLLANCLLAWGCDETAKHTPITYPAVVFDSPYCYDDPTKEGERKECKDYSKDLYLNFEFLARSNSVLWEDIVKGNLNNGSTKFWRLNVLRVSDGAYVTGTWQEDKKTAWLPTSTTKVRFKEKDLKYGVLLRAHFEFCSNDTTNACDDTSAKVTARNINFLMHVFAEEPS